jgi:WD40 repeat protein
VQTLSGGEGKLLTFSPDGTTLAAIRNLDNHFGTAVLVWDVSTGRAKAGTDQGHLDEVTGVAISPDGRFVANSFPVVRPWANPLQGCFT